jgi:hypothetical protein
VPLLVCSTHYDCRLTLEIALAVHITGDDTVKEYWAFFLGWYHARLKQHGEDVLDTVLPIIHRLNMQAVSPPLARAIQWHLITFLQTAA